MSARLELVKQPEPAAPPAAGAAEAASSLIAWPDLLTDFNGLLICANGDCGQLLQFRSGAAVCPRCGVCQLVVRGELCESK